LPQPGVVTDDTLRRHTTRKRWSSTHRPYIRELSFDPRRSGGGRRRRSMTRRPQRLLTMEWSNWIERCSGASDPAEVIARLRGEARARAEAAAIAPDGAGVTHFYLSWTFFSPAVPSPIRLSDSTDGVHWRMTHVAESTACSQASTPLPAGGTVYISYEQSLPVACTRGNPNPAANEMMTAVDLASGRVLRRTVIGPVAGSGDAIVACNSSQDLREVIETAPGHDMRTFELPSIAKDPKGYLYAIWQDRPNGLGGGPSNSTNIYLSFSRDGDKTWSARQQISGAVSATHQLDRVQPWLSSDSRGLHAMWYERVPGPGQDLLQTDTEDLTFATATNPPVSLGGEKWISPPAPIAQTNPNQDPIISNCYAGDYNNIVSSGGVSYVTWGDDRNKSLAPGQKNQPDVFLQRY
jgi:hypothetical protein